MRHLVPERRAPVELTGRPRLGRIERHHATEARAERADHAGQAHVTDREVVVLRKHLDEDRAARTELVAFRERLERLLGKRQHVFAHHRHLVAMQPHDQFAVLDRLELVERVEQREEVIGDHVVRVGLERGLQCAARGGLVAGAQQVHPELGPRARLLAIHRERSACELRRLVEAVVPGGVVARHSIDFAVQRIDLEDFRGGGHELRGTSLEEVDRRRQRARFEAGRVDLQGLLDRRARVIALGVVERELGEQQVRRHEAGVRFQRPLDKASSHGRVLVEHRPRQADARRDPLFVGE